MAYKCCEFYHIDDSEGSCCKYSDSGGTSKDAKSKKSTISTESSVESEISEFIKDFADRIHWQLELEEGTGVSTFLSFSEKGKREEVEPWLGDNTERFLKNTPNALLVELDFLSEYGYITAMCYSPDGEYILVGHSTGLIQMRDGHTGEILYTLRNIMFPRRPVYAMVHSRTQPLTAYAACTDGNVYIIKVPRLAPKNETETKKCIQTDPGIKHLVTQFYGTGSSAETEPFVMQRMPALCLGITADNEKMVVGYGDTSVRVYDMNTKECLLTYKMHKMRLAQMTKKTKRMHAGEVVAMATHNEDPFIFGSAAWDQSLRIWDTRCQVGCMMSFEGVNVVSNSIDFCRQQCLVGSWQPTEALTVWDLVAQRRRCIVRVQNRRPDVDGEYIYACSYWKSPLYNRKAKYGIIGGSGTNCVEVINLHNRYIACSYPAKGSVLAIASYYERIAFGGTATKFYIVEFHDPKHEPYPKQKFESYGYTKGDVDFGSSSTELEHESTDSFYCQTQSNSKSAIDPDIVGSVDS